jgi:hypothetical protein
MEISTKGGWKGVQFEKKQGLCRNKPLLNPFAADHMRIRAGMRERKHCTLN